LLEWARTQKVLRVVDDQISSPTWARTLAEATAQVIAQGRGEPVDYIKEKAGLYHLAGGGSCSRYEWAQEILRYNHKLEELMPLEIQPAPTSEFPTPARRPLFSPVNCDHFAATFGLCLPPWKMALRMAMERSGRVRRR